MKKVLFLATSLCISLTLNAQTAVSFTTVPTSVDVGDDLSVTLEYTRPNAGIISMQIQVRNADDVYVSDPGVYKEFTVTSGTGIEEMITINIRSQTPVSSTLENGNRYVVIIQLITVDSDGTYNILQSDMRDITLAGTSSVASTIRSEDIPEYVKIGDELSVTYTYTNPNAGRIAISIQLQNVDGGYISQILYESDLVGIGTDIEGTRTVTIPTTFTPDSGGSATTLTTAALASGQKYVVGVLLITPDFSSELDRHSQDIKFTDVDTPTVALTEDTGTSDSDGITKNAEIAVGGITQGATWEYKIEGESSFTTGTDATIPASAFGLDGEKTVAVRQIVANNPSAEKSYSFTLDTTIPVITVNEDFIILGQSSQAPDLLEGVLISDSSTITNTGTVNVTTIGEYIIYYDATDLAGNVAAQVSRTYNIVDPSLLIVMIISTTVATDGRTNSTTISYTAVFSKPVLDFEVGDITVSGTANGNSPPEVSNFAGSGNTYTFDVERGSSDGTVIVFIPANMATDTTGSSGSAPIPPTTNVASNVYTVTIDTMSPIAPTVALTEDTGSDSTDKTTSNAQITVGDIEEGATWEYEIGGEDSFTTGTDTIIPASAFGSDGSKIVVVKQRDIAGNYSVEESFSFTLDTTAPEKPIITTRASTSTSTPFEFEGTTDAGTTVELFRENTLLGAATVTDNTDWTFNADLIDGENSITAQATDVAGNVSDLSDVFGITAYLGDTSVVWTETGWSGGSGANNAPGTSDDDAGRILVINSATPAILSTDVRVSSLLIEQGSKLIVQDGKYLEVTNGVRLDGELRLIGKSQLVQTHTGGSMMNMASTSNMYKDQEGVATTTYQYNYWSSPVREVSSQTFSIASVMGDGTIPTSEDSNPRVITFVDAQNGNTNNSIVSISNNWIYSYINGLFPSADPGSGWVRRAQTHDFNPGEGFTLKGPGRLQNYTFTGIPNDGDITTTITGYGDNSNSKYFSLLGNPYPSALDGVEFLTDNIDKIDGLYFWDQKENLNTHSHSAYTGGYATINVAMGVGATTPTLGAANQGNGYNTPTRYIPVGQGFFVRGTSAGGTVIFNNSQRIFKPRGAESVLFKRRDNPVSTLPILRIGFDYIDNNGLALHRQLGISFKEGNTFVKEAGYDTELFRLNDTDAYFKFEGNDEKLVIAGIQQITDNLEFPITIKLSNANPVSLMIDDVENIDKTIYLTDKVTNQQYNLTSGLVQLNISEGTYTNRFYISFSSTLSTETSILETSNVFFNKNTREVVVNKPNSIHLESVVLFNILGIRVLQWNAVKNTSKPTNVFRVNSLASGVYIVRIKTNKGTISKKIVMN